MESALKASTSVIENLLGTPLSETERYDWFTYKPSRFSQGAFDPLKFLLTQGFVQQDAGFSLYQSTSTPSISSLVYSPVLTDLSNAEALVEGTDYFVDYEAGDFTLLAGVSQGPGALMARYTAGFPSDGSGVLKGPPTWLEEAAKAAAIRWSRAMQSKFNAKQRVDMTPEIASIFRFHLNERIRTHYGVHPLRTQVV